MNVNSVNELKELLTVKNIENEQYVIFTVLDDDMNELNVFKSKIGDKTLYCCDIISDDEIINNYYYYSLEQLVEQIAVDFYLI